MPEFSRLLSDKYRAAHGLLTSVDIRDRRNRLGMTQLEFAKYLGVGIASVKRWEMGKIQDARSNALIIEKTDKKPSSVQEYRATFAEISTSQFFENVGSFLYVVMVEPKPDPQQLFQFDAPHVVLGTSQCEWANFRNTAPNNMVVLSVHRHETALPNFSSYILTDSKERRSYVRSQSDQCIART